jgi:phosphomevalonate kinase
MIEAHAPGKLVLCGEYAVLGGAPAIAVAMPARARARVAPADGDSRLFVTGGDQWAFAWTGGQPRWGAIPPEGQGQILEAVAATLVEEGVALDAPLALELDTREFRSAGGDKLGLGSSAALTVALAAALLAAAGRPLPDRARLARMCTRAHLRFQGGAGSGVDVAAAVHGGVVTLAGAGGELRSLAWPAGLVWLAVWSGASASTPGMLDRFAAFRDAEPRAFERHLAVLVLVATAATRAWERQDVAALLGALDDYEAALGALDVAAGIGIRSDVHARLAALAREAGAVYKTSGAGGGDFGTAFAASPDVIARLAGRYAAEGFLTLPGSHGAPGVSLRQA